MKLILKHIHHEPSAFITTLLRQQLETLKPTLQIDEAHILLERRLEESPAFRVTVHLVTPGPDVTSESVDHTLQAAVHKTFGSIEDKIGHRSLKRARRMRRDLKTAAPTRQPAVTRPA